MASVSLPISSEERTMENHQRIQHHHDFHDGISEALPRCGMWSMEEHDRFLHALKLFPDGPWHQLALCVGTRSTRQVQTHAQKYFEKIRRRQRGLQRTYIHSGVVREHRVDDDVIALLSTLTATQEILQYSERGNHDDAPSENCMDESNQFDVWRSASHGELKKSPASKACSSAPKPTLPHRIRIRRSARNAPRNLGHGGLFLHPLLRAETKRGPNLECGLSSSSRIESSSSSSSSSTAAVDEIMLLNEPVLPASPQSLLPLPCTTQLPTIDEALDFFVAQMDIGTKEV